MIRPLLFLTSLQPISINPAKNIIDPIERYFDDTKVVLCISHDIRLWVESRRLNRVVIMKDGRVFKQGDPENIFCDPTIMEFLYGSVLPITQIAQSLSGKGVRPCHYRASTLAEELKLHAIKGVASR
jgi:ABC-type enterochelin transport system ATPase subunit